MASALRVVGSKPGAPESTWSPIHSPSAHTGGHERCPSLTPHWPLGHWRTGASSSPRQKPSRACASRTPGRCCPAPSSHHTSPGWLAERPRGRVGCGYLGRTAATSAPTGTYLSPPWPPQGTPVPDSWSGAGNLALCCLSPREEGDPAGLGHLGSLAGPPSGKR